jgi:hypothetical protein
MLFWVRVGLNHRPTVFQTATLPLSYSQINLLLCINMKKTLFNSAIKKSIYIDFLKNIKPGQQLTIFLLTRGVNRNMRVVSHTGLVLSLCKDKTSSRVIFKKSIYNYKLSFLVRVNSLNLLRFFIH